MPVHDFFRNPEKTFLQISPDGNFVAYLKPYKSRLNLFVENIRGKQVLQLTFDTKSNIMKYFWGNNDRLLYLKDTQGDGCYHLYSVPKNGHQSIDLTPFEKIRIGFMEGLENTPNEILIALNKRDPKVFDLYRLNIQNGNLKMEVKNPGNISHWKSDHEGRVRLAVETDGVNKNLLYRDNENQPFQKILTLNFKETLLPICFTSDNKNIYAVSNLGRDKKAIVEFDLQTKKEKKIIFSRPDVDVVEMEYSKKQKLPVYCGYTTWKYEFKCLTPEFEKIQRTISDKLKNDDFLITSSNDNEDKYLIKTYTDKNLGAYYLYELTTNDLIKIAEVSPWLDTSLMADVRPISFRSGDGLTIHGYLTLPKGKKAEKLPLVVNPHGGPWFRNRWNFNAETQFLANRGYAVLQINYRGSDGYGKMFWQAGFGEIGKKMQDDITDGVRWLISKGIADSNRIGIYGFSFGGYFALNGVIHDPKMYKCAISYSGLTNLFAYLKDMPLYYKPYLQMTYEMVGNPEKDAAYFREYSPSFNTDKIKVPVMIGHGGKDRHISTEEINQFVKAVKKQGSHIDYYYFADEGHGFLNEENKIKFFLKMEEFLNKNLMTK